MTARDRRGRFQAPADAALAGLFLNSCQDSAPSVADAFDVTETEARKARDAAMIAVAMWNWQAIAEALILRGDDEETHDVDAIDGSVCVWMWLGSTLAISPSGKVYAAWTTNQSAADVAADAMWLCCMGERAAHLGGWIGAPDGASGDDVYIGIDADALDDVRAKGASLAMILSTYN